VSNLDDSGQPIKDLPPLSLEALGLQAWLKYNTHLLSNLTSAVCERFNIGRDRVHRIVGELMAWGFLSRERNRLPDGRMGPMLYTLHVYPTVVTKPRPDTTRIPANFPMTPERLAVAQSHGFSPARARDELARFWVYWDAKRGAKAFKRDWDQAWRLWLKREGQANG
jgi:hypothetical protein